MNRQYRDWEIPPTASGEACRRDFSRSEDSDLSELASIVAGEAKELLEVFDSYGVSGQVPIYRASSAL